MAETEPRSTHPRTPLALAILVVGISLNTLGVVLVALRGIGWLGFAIMAIGLLLLVTAIVLLIDGARSTTATRDPDG